MPKRPKMRKAIPTADQKRKKLHEILVKLAVKKYLNEDSSFCICYGNKIYMNMLFVVCSSCHNNNSNPLSDIGQNKANNDQYQW